MKVLHLLDADQYYGAAAVVHDLAISQSRAGFTAEVLCIRPPKAPPGPIAGRLQTDGITAHSWPLAKFSGFGSARKIVEFAANRGIELLHSHNYKTNILLGLLPKHKRMPTLATLHGYTNAQQDPMLYLYYALERLALKRLDWVVAVSDAAGQQFSHNWPSDRQLTISNGLLLDDSHSPSASNAANKSSLIVSVGRLSDEKNYPLLIRAFADYVQHTPEARLTIAGDGPQRSNLAALVAELGIDEQVSLPGYVEDTRQLISECSVYVNCSRSEGMPVSLLEALSVGCPIVASDIPANRELLAAQGLGMLFPDGNSQALCNALQQANNLSPHENAALANKQRAVFEQKHTAKVMCDRYAELYQRLLAQS